MDDVTVVGGFIDNLLKNFLNSLKPDLSKLDKVKAKAGIDNLVDSVKGVFGGGAIVSMLLDSGKELLNDWIDSIGVQNPGPLVVGARRKRTRQEVEDAIVAEGGDPKTFSPFLLLLLQYAPALIELIRKLLGK